MRRILSILFALLLAKSAAALLLVVIRPELLALQSKPNRPDWLPILMCLVLAAASAVLYYRKHQSISARALAWLFVCGAQFFANVPLEAVGLTWPQVEIGGYGWHYESFLIIPAYLAEGYSLFARLKYPETRGWALFVGLAVVLPWTTWTITEGAAFELRMAVCYALIPLVAGWSVWHHRHREGAEPLT